jgi:hypothetical protein
MTETILCEDCGVVVATKGEMGQILHRYGVRHKPSCIHNNEKKKNKLFKEWLK